MPGEMLWQKIPRVRKVAFAMNQEENHNVFAQYPKDSKSEVCKETKKHWPGVEQKPKKCSDGIAHSTEFGDLTTADHKLLTVENDADTNTI